MKVNELIRKLEKIRDKQGNVEVMMDLDSPWAIASVGFGVVEDDDEYPKSFRMPKGFKYIRLTN
jgi:hypothetical protein